MANYRRRISREEILEGAAAILDSGIFNDLTVDSLARHLHMSKSTLYKHFTSKDDLIVAMVESLCRATERELEDTNFVDDPVQAIRAVLAINASHASRLPRALILQKSKLPSVSQERLDRTSEIVGRACRGVVRRGVEGGAFAQVDADLMATCFVACARAGMESAAKGDLDMERGEAVTAVVNLLMPTLGLAAV